MSRAQEAGLPSIVGYDGFDLHIADRAAIVDHSIEVESYHRLKEAFDNAGLKDVKFLTNVGTTEFFDPTSPEKEVRDHALSYLKSRVDITAVLGRNQPDQSCPGRLSILMVPFH